MKLLLSAMFVVFGVAGCLAQGGTYDDAVKTASIYESPDYYDPLPALKEVVAEKAKSRRNTFYVSRVYFFDNGANHAMVYWKEGRALILWEPYLTGTERKHELVWSRRFLSLDKDVVPTLNDVGGSNYLVTREWARRTIQKCVRYGEKFVIYKSSGKYRKAQSNNRMQRTRK